MTMNLFKISVTLILPFIISGCKNEIKKPDITWEEIKPVLSKINEKDPGMFTDIMPILLND